MVGNKLADNFKANDCVVKVFDIGDFTDVL